MCIYSNNNLNTSIGDGGLVFNDITANMTGYSSIITDSENNIIIVGDYNTKLFLNKYNTSGVLIEQNLNVDGELEFSSMAIDSNNKIILAITDSSGDYRKLILYRFNTDLTLDTTFGSSGISILSDDIQDIYITDIVLQSDNKILVAGNISSDEEYSNYLLARFTNTYTYSKIDYLPEISNYKIKKIYQYNNTSYYLLTLSNNKNLILIQ